MKTVLLTLAAVAAIVAGIYAVEWKGHRSGVQAAKLEAAKDDNVALRESKRALDAMHRAVEAQERNHAAELAKLAVNHLKGVRNVEAERDRALADLRAGRIRLRDHCTVADSGGGIRMPPATPGAAGGGVATEAAGLPDQRAESLLREGARADAVVGELNYCWSIVRKDREIVNKRRAAVDGG